MPSPSHFATSLFFGAFSFLVASSSSSVLTSPLGICTYLTTLPLTNAFFRHPSCGYLSPFTTVTEESLRLRYWSQEWRVPVRIPSFFSSTATVLPIRVLKKEKNS